MKEQTFQKFMWTSLILLVLLGGFLTFKTCQGQTTLDTSNLIELNPYENDASGEIFDYDGAILIVPSNVISFTYNTQDNEYIIQYDDPDCFDIDYMTYSKDGDYWYIEITCDSNLFFDYFAYYNSLGGYKDPKFNEASTIYFIEEDFLKNGDSYYKLVKYGTDKEINQ